MPEMLNYGYIHAPPPIGWSIFGGIEEPRRLLEEGQDWERHLPTYETQIGNGFDTMSCVTFSALNCLETLQKLSGVEVNYSDRFTAALSGTTRQGNTFWNVATSIKDRDGVVPEAIWPKGGVTWEEYMLAPVPDSVLREGERWLEEYDVTAEYLTPDSTAIWEALPYGVMQVAIHAYEQPVNGIYPRTLKQGNHAVMLYGGKYGEYWSIYDHYNSATDGGKKKLAWDTLFWGILVYRLKPKVTMTPIKILKKSDGRDVGFWLPATSEAAFESLAYSFGKRIEKTAGGQLDWDRMIEGTFDLK